MDIYILLIVCIWASCLLNAMITAVCANRLSSMLYEHDNRLINTTMKALDIARDNERSCRDLVVSAERMADLTDELLSLSGNREDDGK